MAGDESDCEWEESLVVVELSGVLDQNWTANIGNKCKIVGIDTDQPVMQLDRYIFTGEYKDAIGTYVLFEEEVEDVPEGDHDREQKLKLTYKYKTHKKLLMQRAFLVDKEEGPHDAMDTDNSTGDNSMPAGPPDTNLRGETEPSSAQEEEMVSEPPITPKPADISDEDSMSNAPVSEENSHKTQSDNG